MSSHRSRRASSPTEDATVQVRGRSRFVEATTLNVREESQRWLNLAGLGLITALSTGIVSTSFGVFLPVICKDFGWDRAQFSLAFSLAILALGLPSMLWSVVVNRLGCRFCVLLGTFISIVGIAGLFFVQQVWHIYLLYIIIGLGAGLGGYVPSVTLLYGSFKKGLPLALGIYTSGTGIGGLILPPLVTRLISLYGWRVSFLVLATLFLVGLLVAWVIIRDPVRSASEGPSGTSPSADGQSSANSSTPTREIRPAAVGLVSILRHPASWAVALIAVGMGFVPGLINTQTVAYIRDIGYSPMLAATIMSVISAVSIAGGLSFGAVAVRFNVKHLAAGVLVLIILGFAILATMDSLGMIYVASVLLGFGLGASLPALPTLVGRCDALYRTHILAVGATMICVFQSSAATAAGAIHDATGNYVLAFVIAMVVCGLAIAGVYLIREDSSACEDQGVAETVSARD